MCPSRLEKYMFADKEASVMAKRCLVPAAMALCRACVWALVLGRVADDRSFHIPVLLVLGAATVAGVRHLQVQGVEIGRAATVSSSRAPFTASMFCFV